MIIVHQYPTYRHAGLDPASFEMPKMKWANNFEFALYKTNSYNYVLFMLCLLMGTTTESTIIKLLILNDLISIPLQYYCP